MTEAFPRSTELPKQSPLFWVTHKDRYLRQLLIRDIESVTKRALVVYFANCNATSSGIDSNDDTYVAELLNACGDKPVDLFLETNGGETDATEKLCSLLRAHNRDLRVIVPRRAKSNGTVLALAGAEIVMGSESELGPIDPAFMNIPVEFVLKAPAGSVDPIQLQIATAFRDQTQKLAREILKSGMLKDKDENTINDLVSKIATRDVYRSHGSVIDAREAKNLGLTVLELPPTEHLWRLISLLRAMYQHDCAQQGLSKVFEGSQVSLVVAIPPKANTP